MMPSEAACKWGSMASSSGYLDYVLELLFWSRRTDYEKDDGGVPPLFGWDIVRWNLR